MKCKYCGSKLDENSNICDECGRKNIIKRNSKTKSNRKNSIRKKVKYTNEPTGNMLAIISLLLFYIYYPLLLLVSLFPQSEIINRIIIIFRLGPLFGIVTLIMGRINYPTNKFLKIVMWIIIVSIIFSFIALFLALQTCSNTCSNMDKSGCS